MLPKPPIIPQSTTCLLRCHSNITLCRRKTRCCGSDTSDAASHCRCSTLEVSNQRSTYASIGLIIALRKRTDMLKQEVRTTPSDDNMKRPAQSSPFLVVAHADTLYYTFEGLRCLFFSARAHSAFMLTPPFFSILGFQRVT